MMFFTYSTLAVALAAGLTAAVTTNTSHPDVAAAADGPCNGFTELCDRKYSSISFAASHNAAFVGRLPTHNQFEYPEQGMDMGIRYFTTQVHIEDGEIRQCHSDCALLNVGAFSEIVVSLTTWLRDHPREVVTLLVTNGDDDIRIEEFAPIFEDAGADELAFIPEERLDLDDWPTLGQLIDAGTRLVVFMGEFILSLHILCWKADGLEMGRQAINVPSDTSACRLQRGHLQGPVYPAAVRLLCRDPLQPDRG